MSSSLSDSSVINKVLSNIHKDEKTQKYIIYKEDYQDLNLSIKELKELKNICQNKNIIFEYTSSLPGVEDEELFKLYNDIKNELKENPKSPRKEYLEERRKDIRNKIASANFELVRTLINRRITNLNQMKDIEDIYQIGYTILLEFIDKYDILKVGVFKTYIAKYLIYHILKELSLTRKNIKFREEIKLNNLLKAKENLEQKGSQASTKQLANKLNVKEDKVEDLLNLESLLELISIEEESELLNQNDNNEKSPLYNDSFEEEMFKKAAREIIIGILDTILKEERDILKLYYGLMDGTRYNIIEIAKMYGVSKERISYQKNDALKKLRLTIRVKYLKDLYEFEEEQQREITYYNNKELKEFEENILKSLPKEEFLDCLSKIPPTLSKIIMLNYGLIDGIEYTIREISEQTSIHKSSINTLKEKALECIKNEFLRRLSVDPNTPKEQYLDLLIRTYILKTIPKNRNR